MNRFVPSLAAILVLAGSISLRAQPTRIYLANDDHTDYMWTADAETVKSDPEAKGQLPRTCSFHAGLERPSEAAAV